jgi:hypothetical protein
MQVELQVQVPGEHIDLATGDERRSRRRESGRRKERKERKERETGAVAMRMDRNLWRMGR